MFGRPNTTFTRGKQSLGKIATVRSEAITVGDWESNDRARRLTLEFRHALASVPKEAVMRCVISTPANTLHGLGKRVTRAAMTAKRFIVATNDLVVGGYRAAREGEARAYAQKQMQSGRQLLTQTASHAQAFAQQLPTWLKSIRSNPAETLPEIVGATIGFMVGSGGFDANGGLPDLDLMAGIGHHRSFLTHSILMGAAAEAVLVALDELILLTHEHLPPNHDPIWDSLESHYRRASSTAKIGVAAGIAYHLGVDGTFQVASYKDLPFSAPMEVHQAIFNINSVTEALHASRSQQKDGVY